MRSVKDSLYAIEGHPHSRPGTFGHFSSKRAKQPLYVTPYHVSADGNLKYFTQSVALLVVHF